MFEVAQEFFNVFELPTVQSSLRLLTLQKEKIHLSHIFGELQFCYTEEIILHTYLHTSLQGTSRMYLSELYQRQS